MVLCFVVDFSLFLSCFFLFSGWFAWVCLLGVFLNLFGLTKKWPSKYVMFFHKLLKQCRFGLTKQFVWGLVVYVPGDSQSNKS